MMEPKPKQWGIAYAEIFKDASVVNAYPFRPPYPPQTFAILLSLLPANAKPSVVLDAGCGPGNIARALVEAVDQVDAVDFSAAMIAKGRTLPGGDNPKLHWICNPLETAPLQPTYSLIVAAASLHWMDWPVVLPRFAAHLAATGYLAIVEETHPPQPWNDPIGKVFARYSLNQDFQPYTMATIVQELTARRLFHLCGEQATEMVPFHQPVAEWVESVHARNGFSRDRMAPQAARACDAELTQIMVQHFPTGVIEQPIGARVLWGKPIEWVHK
jgi:trans-aconitate methyltransferase